MWESPLRFLGWFGGKIHGDIYFIHSTIHRCVMLLVAWDYRAQTIFTLRFLTFNV